MPLASLREDTITPPFGHDTRNSRVEGADVGAPATRNSRGHRRHTCLLVYSECARRHGVVLSANKDYAFHNSSVQRWKLQTALD